MPPPPPIKIMVGQGGWLGVCRHPSIEVSAPRLPVDVPYTKDNSCAIRQKTPLPSISTKLGGFRVSKGPLKPD